MAIQTQLKVSESTPGTWRVGESPDDAVVHLYGSSAWRCSEHRQAQRLDQCSHILAVWNHPQITCCTYAEDTGGGNAEMACGEIACELVRVGVAKVPLCPQHYQVVRNA